MCVASFYKSCWPSRLAGKLRRGENERKCNHRIFKYKGWKPKKVLFLIARIIILQYLTQMCTQSKMVGISERFLY